MCLRRLLRAAGAGAAGPCCAPGEGCTLQTARRPRLLPCCSVDDGTLTRTMKPRRPEILKKYAPEVARLSSRLR